VLPRAPERAADAAAASSAVGCAGGSGSEPRRRTHRVPQEGRAQHAQSVWARHGRRKVERERANKCRVTIALSLRYHCIVPARRARCQRLRFSATYVQSWQSHCDAFRFWMQGHRASATCRRPRRTPFGRLAVFVASQKRAPYSDLRKMPRSSCRLPLRTCKGASMGREARLEGAEQGCAKEIIKLDESIRGV